VVMEGAAAAVMAVVVVGMVVVAMGTVRVGEDVEVVAAVAAAEEGEEMVG
jgi:hypothetical protein